jgi:hypothetical protein
MTNDDEEAKQQVSSALTTHHYEEGIKMRRFLAVSVGVMVLSAGVGLKSQEVSAAQVEGVTQAWDKNLPSASRFTVLSAFGGAAVRDNNTGLVWEQAPSTTQQTWDGAISSCVSSYVGNATGWRLPSVVELNSVRDLSPSGPFVPASVFTGVQSGSYWSATTSVSQPTNAWTVNITGNVGAASKLLALPGLYVWCVRGPMQESVY